MHLEDIDPNFKISSSEPPQDAEWFNPRNAPFSIHGVFYDENQRLYLRMPYDIGEIVSPGVSYNNKETSGGRIRFCTNSPYISICYKMPPAKPGSQMSAAGKSGYDLYCKAEGNPCHTYCHTFVPSFDIAESKISTFDKTMGDCAEYTIYMPPYDQVFELYIGLKRGSRLETPAPYRFEKPVVYYGSSITKGGCASRPGNAYPNIISRDYNIDFINLGFSGNAKGELQMAEYIASLEMEAFVCDYDHNAPSLQHLQETLPEFYSTIRAKHPDLPVIFITKPDILLNPGACTPRRDYIRSVYESAQAAGENVYFIDGTELFAGKNWDACTLDTVHPNDLGFQRMATRIGKELKKALNL